MHSRIILGLVAVAVTAGGCTSSGTSPATAPPTTERVTTSTTAIASTTTTVATTTTVDRITEIQAIFEDLEQRRLEAIYTGDTEAFLLLFAATPYRERSLAVFDQVDVGPVPTITVDIVDVLRDDAECLAIYYTASLSGSNKVSEAATAVLTVTDRILKYALTNVGEGGWLCDGPHPLSG